MPALSDYWWVPAILLALWALSAASRRRGGATGRDPKRGYDVRQRNECRRRAGGRCEYTLALFWRCPMSGAHADHIVPHSRGGATSLANAAWTCAWHNLGKGAKMPSQWFIHRLERRRRRYFPEGVDRLVNWHQAAR